MATDAADIPRKHLEASIEDLLAQFRRATANNRCRALFFGFLMDEEEISISPMESMGRQSFPRGKPGY